MKKFISLIVLLVAFSSCEEDVKFNDPAVQALKDNEVWKASNFTAVRGGDNSLTITATNGFESLTLRTESADPSQCEGVPYHNPDRQDRSGCQYLLGYDNLNKATYTLAADGISMVYQTGTTAPAGDEEGAILIYNNPKYTNLSKGYISGEFYFNAKDASGDIVNFQQGVFYKLQIQPAP